MRAHDLMRHLGLVPVHCPESTFYDAHRFDKFQPYKVIHREKEGEQAEEVFRVVR